MNKICFFRTLMAIVIMFTTGTDAQAQGLKGLVNKVKDKTGQTATKEGGGAVAGKAVMLKQPWSVGENGTGSVQATFADGVLTISGTGRMKNFDVTMHSDNRPWGAHAKDITTVIVEEGVTRVSSPAFYRCENITSVSLPSTLTSIGGSAFYGCKSLPTITLPKSLTDFETGQIQTDQGTKERAGLFEQCTTLSEIKVEAGNAKYKAIDGILYEFFSNKWRLKAYPAGRSATKFTIPDNTPVIQTGAFASCQAIKEVILPASCGTIDEVAFKDCVNLQSLTMNQSSGVVSLSRHAFQGVEMTKVKFIVPSKLLNDYKTRPDYEWRDWADQFTGK
ncbi:leucine-rich repeat domain-containing protein [Parabacteroides sp. PF5-9]|uniref:leucine-rich repeat domain-containing protein n=1 Tax=Parabacteroides sp. PF5-9 TaxID=1742404 RepID=UPI002473DFD6|nr:leucine-rich repeat domain-containing protein [Parabacteroides sp. PF5-9]MDH6356998.1 hypothetical protein [Parabacteroides sp. PF5-9]